MIPQPRMSNFIVKPHLQPKVFISVKKTYCNQGPYLMNMSYLSELPTADSKPKSQEGFESVIQI